MVESGMGMKPELTEVTAREAAEEVGETRAIDPCRR